MKDPKFAHPLFHRYQGMIQRCTNPNNSSYHTHGAKGITMCEAWREDFWQFVADIDRECGPHPEDSYTLQRIDITDHFRPGNMRWAVPQPPTAYKPRENRMNSRSGLTEDDVRAIRADKRTLPEIAKQYGISTPFVSMIRNRRTYQWVV